MSINNSLDMGTVPVSPAFGGTGINNGLFTLTLAGSLSTIGAFSSTFTMSGPTAVTFPVSGTLATTGAIPSLGNFTFSANTMTVTSQADVIISTLDPDGNGYLINLNTTNTGGNPTYLTVGGDVVTFGNNQGLTVASGQTQLGDVAIVGNFIRNSSNIDPIYITYGSTGSAVIPLGVGASNILPSVYGLTQFVTDNTVSGDPQSSSVAINTAAAANATYASKLNFLKSRSTSGSGLTAVVNGDNISEINMMGADGTVFVTGASIVSNVSGAVSSGIVPLDLVFSTMTTAGVLTPAITIDISQNSTFSGQVSLQTQLTANAPTPANGSLGFACANNAGNYANILTNTSTAAARTWTLPDATGTIALTSDISSTAVLLSPSADQTIVGAHNLIMGTGSIVAPTILPGNLSLTGNTISSNTNGNINIVPNGTGQVLLGAPTLIYSFISSLIQLQIAENSKNGILNIGGYNAGNGSGSIQISNSRSSTIGSYTALHANDAAGQVYFMGDNGVSITNVASLQAYVGSTYAGGAFLPGELRCYTNTLAGSYNLALTIDSSQNVTLNNASATLTTPNFATAPAASQSSSLVLGSAYQNVLGYDIVLTVYLAVSVATAGTISVGVGPTNTPTQQDIVTAFTIGALSIIPVTIYLPNNYYALLSLTSVTAAITGQQAMPV